MNFYPLAEKARMAKINTKKSIMEIYEQHRIDKDIIEYLLNRSSHSLNINKTDLIKFAKRAKQIAAVKKIAKGRNAVEVAMKGAIARAQKSTRLSKISGIIFNITGGENLTLHEVRSASELVFNEINPNADIMFGALIDPRFKDSARVDLITKN